MVNIETAIDEINTGKIDFQRNTDNVRTTEGEVVILLRRLQEFEKLNKEPNELQTILQRPKELTIYLSCFCSPTQEISVKPYFNPQDLEFKIAEDAEELKKFFENNGLNATINRPLARVTELQTEPDNQKYRWEIHEITISGLS